MGRGQGEFVRLPLRKEGSIPVNNIDLGDLPRITIQSASDICCSAIRSDVRHDYFGDGKYVQEISLRFLILPDDDVVTEDHN